jgi:hypothetical protein
LWENNPDFGELAGLRIDLDRPRMLLHDYIVSNGQAKASALSSRFCRKEGIEHLFPYFRSNTHPVVANRDLYAVAEALRRGSECGLIP